MSPSEKKAYFKKENDITSAKNTLIKNREKAQDKKQQFNNCINTYCNKGCKNTIFEDIYDYNGLSQTHKKHNKKTLLKDNFYKKLNKKTIKFLKSKYAISGCTKWKLIR